MKENLIKFWSQKLFWGLTISNFIIMIIYTILAGIFIETVEAKLINIIIPWIINLIILMIIYIFSYNDITAIYQIKIPKSNDQIKLWKFFLITFVAIWLIFFIGIAFYMFGESISYHKNLDYYDILKSNWWKTLIISFYNTILIVIHRELLVWTIKKQKLPWEKLIKK